jgi:hypothetical protein
MHRQGKDASSEIFGDRKAGIVGNARKGWLLVKPLRIMHSGANAGFIQQADQLIPATSQLVGIDQDAVEIETALAIGLLDGRLYARKVLEVLREIASVCSPESRA